MTRAERFVKEADRIRRKEAEAQEVLTEIRRTRKSLSLKNGAGTILAYVSDTSGRCEIPCTPSSGGPQQPSFTPETARQIAGWILETFTDKEEF